VTRQETTFTRTTSRN